MRGLLHSGGPANIVGHHDDELDTLVQQQASELNSTKRRELMIQIQRDILEEAYMFSPVMASSQWVFDWSLQGFHPNTALSEYNYWRGPSWKGNAHRFLAISVWPTHYREY